MVLAGVLDYWILILVSLPRSLPPSISLSHPHLVYQILLSRYDCLPLPFHPVFAHLHFFRLLPSAISPTRNLLALRLSCQPSLHGRIFGVNVTLPHDYLIMPTFEVMLPRRAGGILPKRRWDLVQCSGVFYCVTLWPVRPGNTR